MNAIIDIELIIVPVFMYTMFGHKYKLSLIDINSYSLKYIQNINTITKSLEPKQILVYKRM